MTMKHMLLGLLVLALSVGNQSIGYAKARTLAQEGSSSEGEFLFGGPPMDDNPGTTTETFTSMASANSTAGGGKPPTTSVTTSGDGSSGSAYARSDGVSSSTTCSEGNCTRGKADEQNGSNGVDSGDVSIKTTGSGSATAISCVNGECTRITSESGSAPAPSVPTPSVSDITCPDNNCEIESPTMAPEMAPEISPAAAPAPAPSQSSQTSPDTGAPSTDRVATEVSSTFAIHQLTSMVAFIAFFALIL